MPGHLLTISFSKQIAFYHMKLEWESSWNKRKL